MERSVLWKKVTQWCPSIYSGTGHPMRGEKSHCQSKHGTFCTSLLEKCVLVEFWAIILLPGLVASTLEFFSARVSCYFLCCMFKNEGVGP